jgi:hypothetical protein
MTRNYLSIGGLILGTLIVTAPVFAEEGGRAESRRGFLLKAGYDAPGTHKVEGGGLDGSTDVDSSGFIAGELYATINPRVELGAGAEIQFPRARKDFTGDFGFIPVYIVARLFPVVGPVSPYVTGRIGSSLFFGDDDYTSGGTLEFGGHIGVGAGLLIQQRLQVEALLSASTGANDLGGISVDIIYSKLGISVGYLF